MLGEANFDDFLDWGLVWGCEAGVFIQYLLGTQGVSKYPGDITIIDVYPDAGSITIFGGPNPGDITA